MPKPSKSELDVEEKKRKRTYIRRTPSRPRTVAVPLKRPLDPPSVYTNLFLPRRISFMTMALALAETFTADSVSYQELKYNATHHLPFLTMLFTTKSTLSLHDQTSIFYIYFKSIVSTDANVAACIDFKKVMPNSRAIRLAMAWDRFLCRIDRSIKLDRFLECVLFSSGNVAEEINKLDPGNFEAYKDDQDEWCELVVYIQRRIPIPEGLLPRDVFVQIVEFKPNF